MNSLLCITVFVLQVINKCEKVGFLMVFYLKKNLKNGQFRRNRNIVLVPTKAYFFNKTI